MTPKHIPTLIVHSMYEDELPQTKASREFTWKTFMEGGTRHSGRAQTLGAIIRRCEIEHIPYRLHAMPGTGYFIERIKEDDENEAEDPLDSIF